MEKVFLKTFNKNTALHYALIALLFYISFYGFSIFYHAESQEDLMNPNTSVYLKIIDEFILGLIGLYIFFLYNFKVRRGLTTEGYFFITMLLLAYYVLVINLMFNNFSSWLYLKNILLSILFLYVLKTLDEERQLNKFLILLTNFLSAALLISILHYFIFPYESYGSGRLLGAFSNPNTTAFVAIFNIIMLFSVPRENVKRIKAKLILSLVVILMTVSIAAYIQFIFIYMLLNFYRIQTPVFNFYVVVSGSFFAGIFLSSNVMIMDKIGVILSGGHTISNRMDGYMNYFNNLDSASDFLLGISNSNIMYDASFLNILSRFGLIAIMLYFSLVVLATYKTFTTKNINLKRVKLINLYFILSVFLILWFIQYQVEIMPTILFINLSLYLILKNLRIEK
jgi:hypothetical protein